MSCEGIWRLEIKGPYGWENFATAFLKNGKYLGASANHYSVGSYKEEGDKLVISTNTVQYGAVRTVFGKKHADNLQITIECKIKKNKIIGTSKAKGIKNFEVLVRLTRLDSLE